MVRSELRFPFLPPLRHRPFQQIRLLGNLGQPLLFFLGQFAVAELCLLAEQHPEYKQAREKMIELLTAKNNVERILGATEKEKNRGRQQGAR